MDSSRLTGFSSLILFSGAETLIAVIFEIVFGSSFVSCNFRKFDVATDTDGSIILNRIIRTYSYL